MKQQVIVLLGILPLLFSCVYEKSPSLEIQSNMESDPTLLQKVRPLWVPDQLLVQFHHPVFDIPDQEWPALVTGLKNVDMDLKVVFGKYGVSEIELLYDVDGVLKSAKDKYPKDRFDALAQRLPSLRYRYLLIFREASDLEGLKASLEKLTSVKKTSYNYYSYPDSVPNDPDYTNQWYLPTPTTTVASIDAEGAWDISTDASNMRVAVIDGGFQEDHIDLAGNVSTTWDVVGDDSDPTSGVQNCDGHGTHVAGTIGAVGNNNHGVSGMMWSGNLALYRKGYDNGSGECTSKTSYYERAASRAVHDGADIINHSWTLCVSDANYDWIENVIKVHQGTVLLVNSAGNDGNDLDQGGANCVQNLNNVLLVANAQSDGTRYSTSNYGATTVHLAAPGTFIYSTVPTDSYTYYTGTSMAAPMVSGVATLAWSQCPSLSVQQIRQIILDTATPNSHWTGLTVTGGILNAEAAVRRARSFCNHPPTSSPGPDQTVDAGITVILDGSGSSDADGDPLTYAWSQVSGPSVSLSGADTVTASFVSPGTSFGTSLTFRLTVNDGYDSDSDTVVIVVNPGDADGDGYTVG